MHYFAKKIDFLKEFQTATFIHLWEMVVKKIFMARIRALDRGLAREGMSPGSQPGAHVRTVASPQPIWGLVTPPQEHVQTTNLACPSKNERACFGAKVQSFDGLRRSVVPDNLEPGWT